MWGISFLIRYDVGLYMLAFSIPFITSLKKLNYKKFILCVSIFMGISFSTLLIYKLTYGSYFSYGSGLLGEVYSKPIKEFSNVLTNYKRIFLFFPLIALIILPLIKKGGKLFSKLKQGMFIYFLIFSYLYFSEFALQHANALHESFTRYALGFYVLSSLLISSFIINLKNKK
jgi:hypothetical protein